MQKKIISIILIIALLMPNVVFAADTVELLYTRTGGAALNTIATIKSDDIWLEGDYSAQSKTTKLDNIKIYNYNGTTEQTYDTANSDTPIAYSETTKNNYYYFARQEGDYDYLFYTIKLGTGDQEFQNIATVIYDDEIVYAGKTYDMKLNIKEIRKTGDSEQVVQLRIGKRAHSTDDLYDLSTYKNNDESLWPAIGASDVPDGNKLEVDVEYFIIDDEGNQHAVSGIFGITDIDLNQGAYVDNFEVQAKVEENIGNTFLSDNRDNIKYKKVGNGTFFYSETDQDTPNNDNAYVLVDNQSKLDLSFTFDAKGAYSSVIFEDALNRYKTITTEVENGTITPTVTHIKDGDDETISYTPNEHYHLKSITVDGTPLTDEELTTNKDSYTFSDIDADHTIKVVYEANPTVTFDSKGGTSVDPQYPDMGGKATEPTDPTRPGYTFNEWIGPDEETTKYDFDTPVTEDITLTATWTPVNYELKYILNGGTRNPSNIDTTFTVEDDDITYADPTREGYTFDGWYLEEDFSGEKQDSLAPAETFHDVTVYAKWTPATEPETDAKYTVEHYLETVDGEYKLEEDATEEKTGEIDSTATATPKEFTGFTENTTHEDRVPTGTIAEDGSLVLKLYYDRIEYKVTFDTKGGKPEPETQIKKYGEKAVEPTDPTQDGYTFTGWYYEGTDGKKYDYNFDDPVTHDVHLIAKWEPIAKEDEKEVTPKQEDKSTSPKILPNTGKTTAIALVFGVCAVAVLGKKYYNLRDINK